MRHTGRSANKNPGQRQAERHRRGKPRPLPTAAIPPFSTTNVIAVGIAATASHATDGREFRRRASQQRGDRARGRRQIESAAAAADGPLHAGGMERTGRPLMAHLPATTYVRVEAQGAGVMNPCCRRPVSRIGHATATRDQELGHGRLQRQRSEVLFVPRSEFAPRVRVAGAAEMFERVRGRHAADAGRRS
jgi:hypothetical protein